MKEKSEIVWTPSFHPLTSITKDINPIKQTIFFVVAGIVCPTGSASINGRCYKYLTQIALSPQDICSSIFGSYVSVIDTEQEKEIHFGENNTITTSGRVWTIGLFDHQQTGFVRTSSGRALKGLPIGVGTLTPENGPCVAFDRSTNLFVSTSCIENPFICETGAGKHVYYVCKQTFEVWLLCLMILP